MDRPSEKDNATAYLTHTHLSFINKNALPYLNMFFKVIQNGIRGFTHNGGKRK
jgi:hypothetical protein